MRGKKWKFLQRSVMFGSEFYLVLYRHNGFEYTHHTNSMSAILPYSGSTWNLQVGTRSVVVQCPTLIVPHEQSMYGVPPPGISFPPLHFFPPSRKYVPTIQAAFALATLVQIRNISAKTDLILMTL